MGKRGNAAQAYPAMEYRFTPERITVTTDDVVCFAWSGEKKADTNYSGNKYSSNEANGSIRSRINPCDLFLYQTADNCNNNYY